MKNSQKSGGKGTKWTKKKIIAVYARKRPKKPMKKVQKKKFYRNSWAMPPTNELACNQRTTYTWMQVRTNWACPVLNFSNLKYINRLITIQNVCVCVLVWDVGVAPWEETVEEGKKLLQNEKTTNTKNAEKLFVRHVKHTNMHTVNGLYRNKNWMYIPDLRPNVTGRVHRFSCTPISTTTHTHTHTHTIHARAAILCNTMHLSIACTAKIISPVVVFCTCCCCV